jgi:hypothetical protein
MWTIILGIFLILHGLVHLLYAGQSRRIFELKPNLAWPDDSWVFTKLLAKDLIRWLATISLLLAALGFIVGGMGLSFQQAWWKAVTVASASISSLIFIVFWDGGFRALDAQGGIGLIINLAILAVTIL